MKKLNQEDLFKIAGKTRGRCFYCNKFANAVDHFISQRKWKQWLLESTPLKGRLHHAENLVIGCTSCNSSKGSKPPEDFMGDPYRAWQRLQRCNYNVGLTTEKNYQGF